MSEIKPALTAEEWDLQTHDHAQMGRPPLPQMVTEYWVELAIQDRRTTPEERNHAMAAMCLYGQPFGFKHEGVAALRDAAQRQAADEDGEDWPVFDREQSDALLSLADRIAALLPPETPK